MSISGCKQCNGTGRCAACGGTGKVEVQPPAGGAPGVTSVTRPCDACTGTGLCPHCKTGQVKTEGSN